MFLKQNTYLEPNSKKGIQVQNTWIPFFEVLKSEAKRS